LKLQIFSDLHVDVAPVKKITIADNVDVVVVPGDTCEGVLRAFEHLRKIVPLHIPIVMTMGNHEYYRHFVPDELALARSHGRTFNIHMIENDTVTLGGTGVSDGARLSASSGVRFVGATLWTDYCIWGEAHQTSVMQVCAAGMNDHRRIGWRKEPWRRFRPQEAALLHHRSRTYIEAALAEPFAGPTVVVTHHAVHWDSVDPAHHNDRVTAAYVSDLSGLIETHQPALWVHGHIHKSSDYRVGKTRILCNPHGYGTENPGFNVALAVELEA
jgi:Icc-related predicted phosphoesterase